MKNSEKNILLVEDDVNFGAILNDFLKLHSYNVTLAKNGIEGLEKFKKNDFGLCILDVMLPFKDGFTLASEIKGLSPDMPIIFLTAKSMKEDVLKGYKVGADDYLKKPFDSDVLLFKIKAILKRGIETIKAKYPSVDMNDILDFIRTHRNDVLAGVDIADEFEEFADNNRVLIKEPKGGLDREPGIGAMSVKDIEALPDEEDPITGKKVVMLSLIHI